MSRQMKKRGLFGSKLFVPLLIVLAVGVGVLMPGIFAWVQGYSVDKTDLKVDLGAKVLNLTSDDAKLEKLQALNALATQSMKYGYGITEFPLQGGQNTNAKTAIDNADKLLTMLQSAGLYCGGLTIEDLYNAVPTLLMSESSDSSSLLVWNIGFIRSGYVNYELSFIFDDATGVMITAAFNYWGEAGSGVGALAADYEQTLTAIAKELTKCYNFTNTEIIYDAEQSRVLEQASFANAEMSAYLYDDMSTFYLQCVQDGQVQYNIPVRLSTYGWEINPAY